MGTTAPEISAQQAEADAAVAADPTAVTPAPEPTPAPIEQVEADVAKAAPAPVQAEVSAIEAGFNDVLNNAKADAPAATETAAQTDPAVNGLVTDAAAIEQGGAVDLAKIVPDASRVAKEVKAGYKTTEFWLSAIVIVLSQLGALHLPGKYGATITTSAAAAAYVVSRGLAK